MQPSNCWERIPHSRQLSHGLTYFIFRFLTGPPDRVSHLRALFKSGDRPWDAYWHPSVNGRQLSTNLTPTRSQVLEFEPGTVEGVDISC